jgi:hypothetical protein
VPVRSTLDAPGVIGGKNRYNFMKEGRDVVRLFDRKTLKWTTLPGLKLSEYRWYPTQVNGAVCCGTCPQTVCVFVCVRSMQAGVHA